MHNKELDSAMRDAIMEVALKKNKAKDIAQSGLTFKKGTRMIQISYWDGKQIRIEPLLIWTS